MVPEITFNRVRRRRAGSASQAQANKRPKRKQTEENEMKHRWMVGILGAAALTCMVTAQNGEPSRGAAGPILAGAAADSSSPRLLNPHPRYRLRPGDTFDVDFALSPEFNQTVSVQPDGYGSFKGVGTIPIQGNTIPELTEAIRTAYAHILHDPLIVVMLKDFEMPYFIATGQVARPGKYDLRSDLTLAEALAVAGGPSDKAKISQIVLYHRTESGFQGKVFNLKKLLASRNLSEDPTVRPGDLLYIPQNVSSRLRPFLPSTSMGAFYNPIPY
jgi:protein involved in polysaccharide export with SLBB domain